jgi:hypothetical protein
MRVYQFDPFAVRTRQQCTVAALRAEAADVDVSIQSLGRRASSGPTDASSLAAIGHLPDAEATEGSTPGA